MSTRLLFVIAFFVCGLQVTVLSQANFTTNGDWNVAANWASNNIGDGGEDVTTDNNRSPIIVNGDNYTIGNMTANGNLTVQSGGTLTLGTSALFGAGTDKNLTFVNNSTLTVAGTLEIWGDLIVNNTLTLDITGNVIVHGDVIMANGGELTVSGNGTLTIGGNLSGGNNSQITTSGSGTIAVTGSISVGGGTSSISGNPGSITAGGGCTCGSCGGACPSTVTPIKLLYFNVKLAGDGVELDWATVREENFSKFIVERSGANLIFEEIGEVEGQGKDTYDLVSKYSFSDPAPEVGYNYYRLKALDIDNSFEMFRIRSIKYDGDQSVNAYPNPFSGESLTLTTNFSPKEGDKVRVINTFGKELFNSVMRNSSIELGLFKTIGPGVYFVQYVGTNHSETIRVIVP